MLEIYENLELSDLVINGEVERWVQVNQVEGLEDVKNYYYVSNFGRVKSTKGNEKILKQNDDNKGGYLIIGLMTSENKQKMLRVHRLVAQAFIEGCSNERDTVDHIFPDTKNNMASNLQWLSRGDNVRKEQSKAVIGTCIKTEKVIEFSSIAETEKNGFHPSAVSSCCKGKRKTHKGYIWKYEEEKENV